MEYEGSQTRWKKVGTRSNMPEAALESRLGIWPGMEQARLRWTLL